MKEKTVRLVSALLLASTFSVTLPAQAAMLPTESLLQQAGTQAERDAALAFFARADVKKAIEAQGVDPVAAMERVAAMTDAEVRALNGKIQTLPAGGDVLDLLLTVFVILLITDILGLTKVFPFTRSIR